MLYMLACKKLYFSFHGNSIIFHPKVMHTCCIYAPFGLKLITFGQDVTMFETRIYTCAPKGVCMTQNRGYMHADIQDKVDSWRLGVQEDDLLEELEFLCNEETEEHLVDAFYKDLEFGTAGLRGLLGVGTNRMNVYTVARAAQGMADYLNAHFEEPSVAIARDSRKRGRQFVRTCAEVLAANGVHVKVFPRIEPVPLLSFAVRHLEATAGIVLTASHNPSRYNGFKAYASNGCQITRDAADEISACIGKTDYFKDVQRIDFDQAVEDGLIELIGDDVIDAFIDAVVDQSVPNFKASDDFRVVYTPLNGAGLECMEKIFDRIGVQGVDIVAEQAKPDGDFPTCPYPNPEFKEALQLGLELCEKVKPDLMLATDPDADRMGVAIPHNGTYELLTGNEMGILLVDWLSRMCVANAEDIDRKVVVTTIVSTDMIDTLADVWGFEARRVLTGFKYIGEQMDNLLARGESDRFLMGFEESYGYLIGDHVRDKDAIVASMLTIEMAAWYAARDMNLYEAMQEIYEKYGYHLNSIVNVSYEGAAGAQKIASIMADLRGNTPSELDGYKVIDTIDYEENTLMPRVGGLQIEDDEVLPHANVLEFRLQGGHRLMVRPSGTEPKIKAYVFAHGKSRDEALAVQDDLHAVAQDLFA